jgi:hypothetical protein
LAQSAELISGAVTSIQTLKAATTLLVVSHFDNVADRLQSRRRLF